MMREWAELEKGGETAYSRLTGDEAMVSIIYVLYIEVLQHFLFYDTIKCLPYVHILVAPLRLRLPRVRSVRHAPGDLAAGGRGDGAHA